MVARRTAGRRAALAALWLAAGAALAGCGGPPDAADAGAARVPAGEADLERGELLSLACRACHTLAPGEAHAIGPNLHGVFGRRAGALDDFAYSAALREADFVWTPERLEAWLAAPSDFLPGTTMTFTGYRSAADRRALIAHLRAATARDSPRE